MRALIVTCLLLAAVPAAADLTLTASNSGKGLAALADGETVTYFKGVRMRSDWQHKNKSFSTLFDLDARRMIMLDHRKKTAEIMTLAELGEAIAPVDKEGVTVEFTELDDSREIAGRTCKHFRSEIRIPDAGVEGGPTLDMTMGGDMWIAAETTGEEDYRNFYLAAAERGIFTSNPDVVEAQPGQARGWALWYREMANAGVPCETETSFRYEGGGFMAKMLSKVGNVTIKSTVQEVSDAPIPDSTFEVPAEYEVKDETR